MILKERGSGKPQTQRPNDLMQNNNQPGQPGKENQPGGPRTPAASRQPARQDRRLPAGRQPIPGQRQVPLGQRQTPAGRQPAGQVARQQRPPGNTGSPPARPTPDDDKKQAEKQPKRQYHWFRAIIMVIATLSLSLFLSIFILDSAQDLFGLNQDDQAIEVTIPEGASNRQVSDLLLEKGVITKSLTFFVYSGLKVDEGGFRPGKYLLNTNMGYDQIIVKLQYGNTQVEIVEGLTFVEGLTLQAIAEKLEENEVCDAQEFIDYLNSAEFDYEFVDRMPISNLRFRRMEGYVFPDTYDFYVDESPKNVAAKFFDNFESKITPEMESRMQELGMTLDETITLASIIQKEVGNEEDMRKVSAAFHNRMNDSATYPNLESDVTIFYVEQLIKPYIQNRNQDMYDAYNTYVCDGLPVGPICNPGIMAIEAALNPADTSDKFFVSDVNGVTYFTETLEEHNEMVRFAKAQEPIGENAGEVHGTGVQGND